MSLVACLPRHAWFARWIGVSIAALASACAGSRAAPEPAPSVEHIIAAPQGEPVVESVGLAHVMRGLHFLQAGKPSAAIPHLKLALIYDADSAYVHYKLVEAWLSAGDRARALVVLEQGLAKQPRDPWLNGLAGELAVHEQRYAEAIEPLSIAARFAETRGSAGPALVDAALWLSRADEARSWVRELLAAAPQDAELALGLGAVLEDHGQLAAALGAYRQARVQRPASAEAAQGEARLLELEGRPAEAGDCLTGLFAYYPDELSLYVQIARLYRRAGRAEAVAYREEALRLSSGDNAMRAAVAHGDLLEGDVSAGLKLLEDAMAGSSRAAPPRLMLAEILLEQGDAAGCLRILGGEPAEPSHFFHRTRAACRAEAGAIDAAMEELLRALERGAAPGEIASEAARLLTRGLSYDEARRRLSELLRRIDATLDRSDVVLATAALADHFGELGEVKQLVGSVAEDASSDDVQLRWADVLARSDDIDGSVALLRRMVGEQPTNPLRLNALGYTLADANRSLDEAEVWLRRAYRMASEEAFIIDSLGWLFYRRGDFESAARLLRRAVLAAPADPEILMHLGIVAQRLGRSGEARELYERALRAHPSSSVRRKLEEQLRGS